MTSPLRQVSAQELGGGHWRVELAVPEDAVLTAHPEAVAVEAGAARVEAVVPDGARLTLVLGLDAGSGQRLRLLGDAGWVADVTLGTPPVEPAPPAPAPVEPRVELDLRARDYDALRSMLLARVAERIGDDLHVHPVSEVAAVVDLMAYLGDALSYSQDGVATEGYLSTARRRVSVTRHAALLNYRVFEGRSARVWVELAPAGRQTVRVPAGTKLLTASPAGTDIDAAVRAGARVFETREPIDVRHVVPLELSRRAHPDGRLAPGAVRVLVEHTEHPPAPGSLAVIGRGDGPGLGHVVRLSEVERKREGLLLRWPVEDALDAAVAAEAPLCVRPGNVVLADHGWTREWATLDLHRPGLAPWPLLPYLDPSMVLAPSADEAEASAHDTLLASGRHARPAVALREHTAAGWRHWTQRATLLSSGPQAPDFVVEIEDDRSARLRFGDGVNGLRPDAETVMQARMRTGSGLSGAIAPATLRFVVAGPPGLAGATNPAASVGAAAPEPLAIVRLEAPRAFRRTDRAVTPADLRRLALGVHGVADAAARIVETGNGPLARVSILPADLSVPAGALLEHVRHAISARQPVGVALQVALARRLPVTIAADVAIEERWSYAAMAARLNAVVQKSLLAPKRFGEAIARSEVIALLAGQPGVIDATLPRFGWTGRDPAAAPPQQLEPPFGAVLRIDNDPLAPERGSLTYRLRTAT